MARIPNDHLDRIKQEISLQRLAEEQGHTLKQHGKDYAVCCPFHDDATPSCVISPASNLFHCFGCGAAGSVIDWVMKTQGVSFKHAAVMLRDAHFPHLAAEGQAKGAVQAPVKNSTVPTLPCPVTPDADDQALMQQVMSYYHQTLKQEPEAKAYLQKRGLDDAELINHFMLGYANRTLGLRLPKKNRQAGKAIREQLQGIGLYRETGREHFAGSLVIPVQDANGVITEVYGRKLLDNLRQGTPKHLYLPGPHMGVFNAVGLCHAEEVILCESLLDALTFWRWGFRHVTTSYGTQGFTEELLYALTNNAVKRVLIAYDRDESGDKAAAELATKLQSAGMDCFRVLFPKGMDANDYACQMSPPQKALALVIRKAEWMGQGKPPERQLDFMNDASRLAIEEPACVDTEGIAKVSAEHDHVTATGVMDEQASPTPPLPSSGIDVIVADNGLFITLGDRVYRIRGFDKDHCTEQLKIQLLVKRDEAFHIDKLDLYSSKQRQVFINQASVELGLKDDVIKKDLGKVLLTLEEQQTAQEDATDKTPTELAPQERKAALALLHDTDLLNRILSDFNQAGVVGEETNKLAGYLACVSRKLDRPLAVMIQSSSAAGKSSLMDAILALMPENERVQYSAMTGQSLFYMGETNLKHKILAISEEEGASNASYALKLLQSEGEVTIASTGKDDSTGNLVTKEYKVEGPVMLFLTTTAIDIDEELLNRCVVLTVNESRAQTQAIHAAQRSRRTLQGLQSKLEKKRIIQLHQNAQRLLKPLAVINPYADQLTFLDDKTRTRRDHEKYLTLIDSIALLHQYQREVNTIQHNDQIIDYVEVTLADIDMANRLAHEILGRTLDELPPQTRTLLKHIQALVQGECQQQDIDQRDFRFSRRHIRGFTQWSDGQLKIHCKRLEEMEYLLVHRGGRGQSMEYELLYSGDIDSHAAHMMGLLDVEPLSKQKQSYDKEKLGQKVQKSDLSQGQVRPKSERSKSLKGTSAIAYRASGQGSSENASRVV